jgi:7-keto-8-aminopelargonate synthetase-like enzyme
MSQIQLNEISFSGTAYLGMPFNKCFRKLVLAGMELYGINHGASRNNNITLDVFSKAETAAAKRYLAQDSIIVSSGYLAAQLVIQNYYKSHQLIYAPDSHPALHIGNPTISKQNYDDWIEETLKIVNSSNGKPILIISTALNNLEPNIFNFSWVSRIEEGASAVILVDDSHSLGIIGQNGEGTYAKIPNLPHIQKIVISSMAKALGIDAGIILASSAIIQDLRKSAIYAGSSPPSPGLLYAYVHSEDTHIAELVKLRKNINHFVGLLNSPTGLSFVPELPVFLIKDQVLAEGLLKRGLKISSFPYPDPQGKKLNRIVLSSAHKFDEIVLLANLINELNEKNK